MILLLLLGARNRSGRDPGHPQPLVDDIFSFSEPLHVRTDHIELDLSLDFERRVLSGSATLHITNLTGTRQLHLDTESLVIESVRVDGEAVPHQLGVATRTGARLTVPITGASREVTIRYGTSPGGSAFHWNSAAQTAGRTAPYFYTQNEPSSARSWIPSQDTPSVRSTYEATIRVPRGMLALMSAENPSAPNDMGIHRFRMEQPVPTYLIALAAGRLQFRALDERVGIYAEPELIDAASKDLAYLPDMVDAAERLLTPYPWKRYDILLMPPTYVVGGMEHPRLNFITPYPTVHGDAGARVAMSSLLAHEIAHSWSGDLVTLSSWHDLWLNEGITSYLTHRILEELEGPRRSEHGFFNDRAGYEAYLRSDPPPMVTKLHRDFSAAETAGSAFHSTAYVKGSLFMKTLEDRIGRAEFDEFLKSYFRRYAMQSVDEKSFVRHLRETVLVRRPEPEPGLELDEWIYGPGLPSNLTAPLTSAIHQAVLAEANRFRAGTRASSVDRSGWTSIEESLFLQLVSSSLDARIAEVDGVFGFSSRNSVPYAWASAVARTGYAQGEASLERMLARGGPNTWVTALYDTMIRNASRRTRARELYDRYRDRYHPSVASRIEEMFREVQKSETKRRAA